MFACRFFYEIVNMGVVQSFSLPNIDDKLSRIARCPPGQEDEDVLLDLIGYLTLLLAARSEEQD